MHKLSSPLELASGTYLLEGSGNPEGAVSAPAGSLYLRSNGTIYRKVSGSGNTSWQLLAGLVSLTQAQYDALPTKDANTLYAITG